MPEAKEQSQPPNERQDSRTPEEPKPVEEIQLNLKKFALFLGIVLLLATIGGAIAEFGP